MNRSALPAALLAVCCALFAAAVLRSYNVPLLAAAAAQPGASAAAPPPFNLYNPATLRPAHPAERQKAVASIAAQLTAFNTGDYAHAAQFQSMSLRQNFPSVAFFRHMIETTYPQFAHSRKVAYGPARAEISGSHVLVPVTLTGQDGITLQATYIMVREGVSPRSVYRVEGVLGGTHPLPSVLAPGTGRDA